jgi:hypothetical protein
MWKWVGIVNSKWNVEVGRYSELEMECGSG